MPTLRRKKGTEKLAPVICAHAEAEEGYKRSLLLSSVPTLRQKKGTEKLAPVICAHAEAEEGHREACSYLLCPRCDGIEAQEGVRRIGKSKDSDLCASAHRCPHYAYARLIARVTFNLVLKAMDGGRDASAAVDESITGEGVHRHDGRVA